MSRFKYLYPEWNEIEPAAWLAHWAARFGDGDNPQYFELITKITQQGRLLSEDFEQAGRWKEGCLKPSNGRWKTGTPAAYDTWMEAQRATPECPDKGEVARFLECWSERRFDAGKKNGLVLMYRFGLSRATTLLHFMSEGRYPILDSRVATAMVRLGSPIDEGIVGYLSSFCPAFAEIASECGVSGIAELRKLDNALFNYGADSSFPNHASS